VLGAGEEGAAAGVLGAEAGAGGVIVVSMFFFSKKEKASLLGLTS
jgi:hypothetical protein